MNQRFPFFGKRIVLSGDVLSLRFILSVSDEKGYDEDLRGFLQKKRGELESEINEATKKFLGPQFEVRSITFPRGSVEILILIGTIYYAISHYKQFVESIELLTSQLESLFTRRLLQHFEPLPISVYGTWSPGPALARAGTLLSSYGSLDAMRILLWYIIISHAALLMVFIWMLVKR